MVRPPSNIEENKMRSVSYIHRLAQNRFDFGKAAEEMHGKVNNKKIDLKS